MDHFFANLFTTFLKFNRRNKVRGHFRDVEKIWKQVRERKAGNVSEGENVIRQTER